ncbi:hypothetical protein [Paraburkholderia sp. CI3]|uniref:hypothetical protein n=1 Tax=Paraburkholderia sp. CI3 TaxID=2991060 RepID=UPI003D22BDE3
MIWWLRRLYPRIGRRPERETIGSAAANDAILRAVTIVAPDKLDFTPSDDGIELRRYWLLSMAAAY